MLGSCSLTPPTPPTSPLLPYTTLFRSHRTPTRCRSRPTATIDGTYHPTCQWRLLGDEPDDAERRQRELCRERLVVPRVARRLDRSEEHTSELQSLTNLVCRPLP